MGVLIGALNSTQCRFVRVAVIDVTKMMRLARMSGLGKR